MSKKKTPKVEKGDVLVKETSPHGTPPPSPISAVLFRSGE